MTGKAIYQNVTKQNLGQLREEISAGNVEITHREIQTGDK